MGIHKLIVPVDFSSATEKLVDYAVDIASRLEAEIIFCHIIEPLGMGDMMLGSPSLQEFQEKMNIASEERIRNLITDNQSKCSKCSGKILHGDIVDEIVSYAKEQKADMIIIGTHGAKGLEKFFLGRVAERVVQLAPCPCLVMNPYKN